MKTLLSSFKVSNIVRSATITLSILALVSTILFNMHTQIAASGLETQTTKGDQVIVVRDGEVVYLSTDVEATSAAEATRSGRATISILGSTFTLPTGFASSVGSLINSVLSFVMVVVALLVLYNLIMGGFTWITSGGDKSKIDTARNRIIAAIVGTVIVASSYAILLIILQVLGFSSLNDLFTSMRTLS